MYWFSLIGLGFFHKNLFTKLEFQVLKIHGRLFF